MFNDVGAINLRFSTVEGAVVRGHAVQYAERPHETDEPEPEEITYARRISLKLKGHLVARGRIEAGDNTVCSAAVDVRIERRTGNGWKTVREIGTDMDGKFGSRLPDRRGKYRAAADEEYGYDGENDYTCGSTTSEPVAHRHN